MYIIRRLRTYYTWSLDHTVRRKHSIKSWTPPNFKKGGWGRCGVGFEKKTSLSLSRSRNEIWGDRDLRTHAVCAQRWYIQLQVISIKMVRTAQRRNTSLLSLWIRVYRGKWGVGVEAHGNSPTRMVWGSNELERPLVWTCSSGVTFPLLGACSIYLPVASPKSLNLLTDGTTILRARRVTHDDHS